MTRRPSMFPAMLASMSASVRAINPALATQRAAALRDLAGEGNAAVEARATSRTKNARQGRTAQRAGATWEREVFAALDAMVRNGALAWWAHTSPGSKRLRDGRVIVTGRALCDVVGVTGDGRGFVAEVKRHGSRVEVVAGDRGGVQPHQRAQLDATAGAGGVALLVACVGDVRAVIPWRALDGVRAVTKTVARSHEARGGLLAALQGAAMGRDGR